MTPWEEKARIFKALSDPRRIQILELLQSGEKCACVLIDRMQMPQSSLSYHMKILCESHLVVGRNEGKWTHYRIDPFGSAIAVELLRQLTATDDACPCKDCCP